MFYCVGVGLGCASLGSAVGTDRAAFADGRAAAVWRAAPALVARSARGRAHVSAAAHLSAFSLASLFGTEFSFAPVRPLKLATLVAAGSLADGAGTITALAAASSAGAAVVGDSGAGGLA
jgi:hypothetical protein